VHGQPLPPSFFIVAVGSVLTFWHNVLMQSVGYFNYCMNIYWSLSVEEVFYLVFPLAAAVLGRTRWFVALCALAVVAGPIYRGMHADNELYFMYGYIACFDAIALGCIAALLKPAIVLSRTAARTVTLIAASALAATYLIGIDGHEAFGFTAIALATTLLLLTAPDSADSRPIRLLAPLRWMGRHSYELYLFHIIVLAAMRDLVPRDALAYAVKPLWLALFVALSCAIAALVSRLFAEPLNKALRLNFVPVRPIVAESLS
jgi:peptidoglycan/LPS O-acetylase OafA/YrhL